MPVEYGQVSIWIAMYPDLYFDVVKSELIGLNLKCHAIEFNAVVITDRTLILFA